MTRIAAVHGALPPHRHTQREVTDLVARTCLPPGADRRVLDRLHENARVRARHTVLPLDGYRALDGFGATNDVFIRSAVDLGARAVRGALRSAGLRPTDVDLLMFTSVTGIAAPSVDARLVTRLGMRSDVKRLPVFGLGCVAGAAGTARLHDYLLGRPDDVAVLLSVELCSLTFQRHDASPANLVATALFGDGAAALVALGGRRAVSGPEIVATRSRMYPDTEHVMGWDVGSTGFRVVLDPAVPDVVRQYLADDVREFLDEHGLKPKDVAHWVCHPGGPKVLEAVTEVLDLPDGALDVTWRSLADVGNLSSSSVLHVLRDTIEQRRPEPGTPGLLLAMGPGFCCELVLLRW
ncbi:MULTISPECIES: type III polyketide synthase [Streptomyces]|uniref:Type-III PKS n=1 Tax=Streptomyces griseus subsp. griseus (strain JCM 4626 / CBS 651.72 / NBRC 13350 / KCC S-0626 / ISP 5235) TaxID=455632 RepID=B1VQK0_STRGG|nr:3-oxoacyl-[acyl-carrier-protein] synthase III C-terminal domain-containing protein [Streptomyces griseus]MBW3702932.1 type III polyketide synthase [Streptomyces griseus]NEB55530.1 type III polyketide synthase [Streptomyces griseus]SED76900.1 isopalmitoylresorcinol synthase [Streptomyces griseus]SQA24727.1 Type-III PKS [Streptomyces griseus]BAG17301.1 type-III PKS [Streptomyces griseus subsp. griseus NBRC 13350]